MRMVSIVTILHNIVAGSAILPSISAPKEGRLSIDLPFGLEVKSVSLTTRVLVRPCDLRTRDHVLRK